MVLACELEPGLRERLERVPVVELLLPRNVRPTPLTSIRRDPQTAGS